MTPKEMLIGPMQEAYDLLPKRMETAQADIMMLAIGLQESRFEHRRQIKGPARGFWQFERGGGVRGVLTHNASRDAARSACMALGVKGTIKDVYHTLEHNDVLAAVFARLLLWTDPRSLPGPCEPQAAWDLYARTWRPGKPHRHTWDDFYDQATIIALGTPR